MDKKIEEIKHYFDEHANEWNSHLKVNYDLIDRVLSLINFSETDKILDVACGTGVITGILAEKTKEDVTAVDLSEQMIKIAQETYKNKNIQFFIENFLTFKSTGFDKIFIYNAYPHFLNIELLKKSLYKNLNNDGIFVIFSNLSINQVNSHHKKCLQISRIITSFIEDMDTFKDLFDIEIVESEEDHYLCIGRKKV